MFGRVYSENTELVGSSLIVIFSQQKQYDRVLLTL